MKEILYYVLVFVICLPYLMLSMTLYNWSGWTVLATIPLAGVYGWFAGYISWHTLSLIKWRKK